MFKPVISPLTSHFPHISLAVLQRLDYQHTVNVLTWLWWLTWTPILACHIARQSYGWSIRRLIISSLIFPSIITLLIFQTFQAHIPLSNWLQILNQYHILDIIIIITGLGFVALFHRWHTTGMEALNNILKPTDNCDYKVTRIRRYFLSMMVASIGICCVFLFTDIYGLVFFAFVITLPSFLVLVFGNLFLFKEFFKC